MTARVTSRPLTRAQARNLLRLFSIEPVEIELNIVVKDQTHEIRDLFGTGIGLHYSPETDSYRIVLRTGEEEEKT